MKTTAVNNMPFMSQPIVPLPNASSRRQFLHKALDGILVVVSGVGIAVMLVFFLMLI